MPFGLGETLQAGSDVQRIAERRNSEDGSPPRRSPTSTRPVATPMRVCRRRTAPGADPADGLDDLAARAERPLGIVLMGARIAEVDEHTVADIARDETVEARHDPGAAVLVGPDDRAQVLRVELPGKRGRADEVAEHDGEIAPFGLGEPGSSVSDGSSAEIGFAIRRDSSASDLEQALAMAERDAEVDEIALR